MVQMILRSLLEQIRFSILTTENSLYQQSIKETTDWLARYYETNSQTVKQIEESLTALKKINLRPELPNLTTPQQITALRQLQE